MLYSPRKLTLVCALLPILLLQTNAFAHDTTYPSVDCETEYLAPPKVTSFLEALDLPSPAFKKIKAILSKRTVEEQYAIDQKLTELHAAREMSFQVKNPVTNRYDKFVEVPSTGVIAPMREADFHRLVASTQPLMQAMRALLQKIYSVPQLTVESLGFQNMPRDEAELALRVIRDSMYLEPMMRDPRMKNYPFLPIAGFDGSIGDPKNPQPENFEINLGTPSGLSNNILLIEALRTADPELYKAISPYMPTDNTFQIMRHVMYSNAREWTKQNGMVVAISPGTYNGAHPDVAMIAKMAGFPLVRSSDLYQDENGDVKLDTGLGHADPIVIGIYGRMEESFFLQSNDEGIPSINPNLLNDEELQHRLGVKLRKGANYEFIYDDHGKIADVVRDEKGHPKLLPVWDTIQKGSFRNAVLSGKLYYSAIGGRVLDDKRLFRILTQYLVPNSEERNLARPIKSLKLSEFGKFYDNPKRFVVKEPGNSGGVGIYFPKKMSDNEIAVLIAKVKKVPTEFEIQYYGDTVTVPRIQKKADGQLERYPAFAGVRIYDMMDAHGIVMAGPNAALVRLSPPNDPRDNTSSGGGYGELVVLSDRALPKLTPLDNVNGHDLYQRPRYEQFLTPSSEQNRIYTFQLMQQLESGIHIAQTKNQGVPSEEARTTARNLSFALRELMIALDDPMLQVIPKLRDFADGHMTHDFLELQWELDQAKNKLLDDRNGFFTRPGGALAKFLRDNDDWKVSTVIDPVIEQERKSPVKMKLRRLPTLEKTYQYDFNNPNVAPENRLWKVEVAEYEWVDDPKMQKVLDHVHKSGGQVRLLRCYQPPTETTPARWSWEPSYFWVNLVPTNVVGEKLTSHLIPIISTDLLQKGQPEGIKHELVHFDMWHDTYDALAGVNESRETVAKKVDVEIAKAEYRLVGEKRAIAAEMRSEIDDIDSAFHQPYQRRKPSRPTDFGYVNRVMYPEFEAVLAEYRTANPDQSKIWQYGREMVRFARDTRAMALHMLDPYNDRYTNPLVKPWRDADIFSMLARPYGVERLQDQNVEVTFREMISGICQEMGIPVHECQPQEEGNLQPEASSESTTTEHLQAHQAIVQEPSEKSDPSQQSQQQQ